MFVILTFILGYVFIFLASIFMEKKMEIMALLTARRILAVIAAVIWVHALVYVVNILVSA